MLSGCKSLPRDAGRAENDAPAQGTDEAGGSGAAASVAHAPLVAQPRALQIRIVDVRGVDLRHEELDADLLGVLQCLPYHPFVSVNPSGAVWGS
jgi:hypothetical protein